MPDPRLMMVLQKDQTRKKKRTIAKLEGGPERLWMTKKQPGQNKRSISDEDVYYS